MIAIGGENLIDLFGHPGGKTYAAHPGGSPFNVAMAAARQGAATAYLTPISQDAFGDMLAARLADSGAAHTGGRVDAPTSLAIATLDANRHATYEFYRNDTAERQITADGLAAAMPDATAIFHIGSAALIDGDDAAAWEACFMEAHARDIFTGFDPNIRPSLIHDGAGSAYRARIKRMLAHADLVKSSDEDLAWLYPDCDLEAARKSMLADAGEHTAVVITYGADGARGACGDYDFTLPAYTPAQLGDTVGAGDVFMATLLVMCLGSGGGRAARLAALQSPALEAGLKRAVIAAGLNCEKHGCHPPDAAMIDALL